MRTPTTIRQVDLVAGGLLVLFGAFVVYQSLQLSFYADDVPGPGFFPTLLGVALAVTGAGLVVSRLLRSKADAETLDLPRGRLAVQVFCLWGAVFIACLAVNVLGFVLTMALLVALILFVIERHRTIGSVVATIAIPAFAWFLFGWLLQVPLPNGVFGS